MSNDHNIPLTCEDIQYVAEHMASQMSHSHMDVPHILLACFQDREFSNFLEKNTTVENIKMIAEDLARQISQIPPQDKKGVVRQTKSAQELMKRTSEWIKKDVSGNFHEKQALTILWSILELNNEAHLAKIFTDLGIEPDVVGRYIFDEYGQRESYLPSEILRNLPQEFVSDHTHDESGYKPVMGGRDSSDALVKYCSCFNDMAHEGKLSKVIGREKEVEDVIRILRRKNKNDPLLIGEPGVGKTAIIEKIAQMQVDGELPDDLKDIKIINLDLGSLLEGTKYRGDVEKRLKSVLESVMYTDDAYLFIDEIHMIMGAGSSGSSVDVANILKPYMARDMVRVIGATTRKEYKRHISKDGAMTRRFKLVDVPEPTAEECYVIMRGLKKGYEEHHKCHISDETLKDVVDLSIRHIHDQHLPDKAKDLLDSAGALLQEKEGKGEFPDLTKEVVAEALSKELGIPLQNLAGEDKKTALSLSRELKKVVFGQDDAADLIEATYVEARAGLGDADKPMGSFLFKGPTGVGKTEISKKTAELLGIPLIRFDMSEYMERHSVSKLFGSPPGYVGNSDGGLLTEAVKKNKHCLLLLDEIEKAHPDVHDVLLQVMDYGCLTDGTGEKIDFRNVILVSTTNAGAGVGVKRGIGFSATDNNDLKDEVVNNTFSPEFRNRLSAEVDFNYLDKEQMPKIVDKVISELRLEKLDKRGVEISFTEEAKQWLVDKGYNRELGARPLKRVFSDSVTKPLAYKMLEDEDLSSVVVIQEDDGLELRCDDEISNDNALEEKLSILACRYN